MSIFYNLVKTKNTALALGFFDGVHKAHKTLILKTAALAKENGIKSALITFKKSPYSIISGEKPVYITNLNERLKEIKLLGIDDIFVLDFEEFKNMKAEQYIDKILIPYFSPDFVVTGFNHTFGYKAQGTGELLSKKTNYVQIPPQTMNGELISSTNIKSALNTGNIEFANSMLGRRFSYTGNVIKGAQIARLLGYNTANLIWSDEIVRVKYGVYKGFAYYEGKKYPALINFGIRPTIDKDLKETLEVHLSGFEGDLYNKTLKVEFLSMLREEIKFSSPDELKKQIDKDFIKALQACKQE
ncbi:MAG: riboflavin biosynthesis protein RibF [Candidatus Gastranaerophilales bacterium]|nr:riboflavin biosynthesis protein RibF [Candidatus Gastranaerophilales bacterium]